MKTNYWRLIVIAAVLAWGLFYAWPRADRPVLNMNLGLDLKGGSHLVMKVMTDDAIEAEMDRIAGTAHDLLVREGYVGARPVPGEELGTALITDIAADRLDAAESFLDDEFEDFSISVQGEQILMRMPESAIEYYRDNAVKQSLQAIRNRIDEFGVAEPNIQRLGGTDSDRILVELPGVEDPARVKKLIQTEARLELRLLHYSETTGAPVQAATKEGVLAAFGGQLPVGVDILPLVDKNELGERVTSSYYAVEKRAALTGDDLQDARHSKSRDFGADWVVTFQVRVGAADGFARFTRENINRQMPIVLDGTISSAPVIESEISTNGQISGRFTLQEAEDLALVLRAGALPAKVITLEERTVGPSLGLDSIKAGVNAAMVGFVLVMIFMLIYYKLSGINAVIALLLNLLLVAGALASFGARLTLPGIAGFILTVGMAVDANVLIFERIREELRMGKTVKGALDGGFGKALSAIVDANITTLIAAIFLFQYGTGPVRGFAITLSIGIIASLFTAVFVSKTLFGLVIGDRAVQRLSI